MAHGSGARLVKLSNDSEQNRDKAKSNGGSSQSPRGSQRNSAMNIQVNSQDINNNGLEVSMESPKEKTPQYKNSQYKTS